MIVKCLTKDWNWLRVSSNPGITMKDIINHPEYPWEWNSVIGHKFTRDKTEYVNNQIGRVLLVSMLDEYNTDNSTLLNHTLLVLYNDYQLSQILSYI